MESVRCANCQSLQRRVHDLQAENQRLRRQLDEATPRRQATSRSLCQGPTQAEPAQDQAASLARTMAPRPTANHLPPNRSTKSTRRPCPTSAPTAAGPSTKPMSPSNSRWRSHASPFIDNSTSMSATVVSAIAAFKDAIPCKRPMLSVLLPPNWGQMPKLPSSNSTSKAACRTARSRAAWRVCLESSSVAVAASTPSCGSFALRAGLRGHSSNRGSIRLGGAR